MRYGSVVRARPQPRRDGSVLLVVLGVLTVLSLIGLSFVLFARTESKTARNFRLMTEATLLAEGEVERVKAALLNDLYPAAAPTTGTSWRLWGESYDYPNADDGWLFGMTGDGTAVLQTSFGGTATPTVDNDARDTPVAVRDSVWRTVSLSSGLVARVATLVMDQDGLANLDVWGNTQDPTAGTHSSHQGLGRHELNLMRVLWPDALASDVGDTYRALFLGRVAPHSVSGRYGLERPGVNVGPGALGADDDGDSGPAPHVALIAADDDADGTADEADEGCDEPDECCWSNPGGTGDDRDLPFDQVDLWELLHDGPFQSRLECLLGRFDLDAAFAPGTNLGSYRRNLTTLSADSEWVGAGALDVPGRLQVRLDLNHATLAEFETAFRQAGFDVAEARQLTVNLADARDTDDDVTCHPNATSGSRSSTRCFSRPGARRAGGRRRGTGRRTAAAGASASRWPSNSTTPTTRPWTSTSGNCASTSRATRRSPRSS
jgi:hypothetical protein